MLFGPRARKARQAAYAAAAQFWVKHNARTLVEPRCASAVVPPLSPFTTLNLQGPRPRNNQETKL